MCGRYNEHLPKMIGWAEALKVWPSHQFSYNRAPTTKVAAFRRDSGELMRWGMIPSWSKEFSSSYSTFNARIETVADKPTFKHAWANSQRCLIPMAGYYEWKGEKGNKQPFYITDRDAGGLVVAGLYESWGDNSQLSCTILTKPANELLAPMHHRMPVLLNPSQGDDWLNLNSVMDQNSLLTLDDPNVIYFPVSKAVGSVRNDSPELIKPID
jgi:putative SOS response-associated peptidase YedK